VTASLNLDSRTLVTRIADLLRDQIIAGELEPGTRIRQDEYAEVFGLSRTPLREAFRLLEAEGWIEMRPRSGVAVSRFSPTEVQDILTMRLLLEPLAIRVTATNHTAEEQAQLQQLHDRLRSSSPTSPAQADAYDVANQEFHFALYGLKPAPLLDPVHAGLRGYWERYTRYRRVYYGRTADSISQSSADHVALLHAWIGRNADEAELLLAQHILRAGHALVRSLAADESLTKSPQLLELAKRYDCVLA
jgi:DNA-binding GntR family transcriptional regulator